MRIVPGTQELEQPRASKRLCSSIPSRLQDGTAYGPCGLVLNIVKVGEPLVLIRKYHAQNPPRPPPPPPPEKLKPYTLTQAPKPLNFLNSQSLTPCLKARSPETPKQLHVHGDTKDGRHLGLCSGLKGLGRRDLTLSFVVQRGWGSRNYVSHSNA